MQHYSQHWSAGTSPCFFFNNERAFFGHFSFVQALDVFFKCLPHNWSRSLFEWPSGESWKLHFSKRPLKIKRQKEIWEVTPLPPKKNLQPRTRDSFPQVYSSQSLCALRRSKPWGVEDDMFWKTFHLPKSSMPKGIHIQIGQSSGHVFNLKKHQTSSSFTNSMFGIQMEGGKLLPFDGLFERYSTRPFEKVTHPSSAHPRPHKIAGLIFRDY